MRQLNQYRVSSSDGFVRQILDKLAIKYQRVPLALLIVLTCLLSYGLVMLYAVAGGSVHPWAYKQFIHLAALLPLFFVLWFVRLRHIFNLSYVLYFLALALLLGVSVMGTKVMGAKRWISILGLRFQPVEPMKIALVLALARHLHYLDSQKITKIKYLLLPIGIILVPAIITIKQPDLGTGIVLLLTGFGMLFVAGVNWRKFAIAGVTLILLAPLGWQMLHDYQRKRLLIFLYPDSDPLGSGYNIIQSQIAIGSGGIMGKGLGQGTQYQLDFLPEAHTDFIFACLAEDLGLIGSTILLLLYASAIIINVMIANAARSRFAKLVVIGINIVFFCHAFINLGMVSGVLPVVGVPLPFISYGGALAGSLMIGFGLIVNTQISRGKI